MTDQDLKQSLNMTLTNFNKPIDENIVALWKGLFMNFNAKFFKMACLKVISTNKFFPNASEIIDAYRYVKHESERERFDRLKENQRLLTTAEQEYCYLCDNSGYCVYRMAKYEYIARCICSHGRDLNKFSESQINQEHVSETKEHYRNGDNAQIKRSENPFYIKTIKEVLSDDDYVIYEAYRKEKYLSRENSKEYRESTVAALASEKWKPSAGLFRP